MNEKVVSENNKIRISELDFFRFIAVILVMMYHHTFRGFSVDNMSLFEFSLSDNKFGKKMFKSSVHVKVIYEV